MTGISFAALVGPFAVGLCIGAWRGRRAAAGRAGPGVLRLVGVVVGLVATALTALILVAKLFDSATLGWMFGLGLMLAVVAMPSAVLFAIGHGLGAALGRRRRGKAIGSGTTATFTIAIERDSVHASDDEGLAVSKVVRPDLALSALLDELRRDRFLPSIHGGRATWMVASSGHAGQPIGVIAEQWDAARLDVPDETVERHFAGVRPALRLDYRAQVDPSTRAATATSRGARAA